MRFNSITAGAISALLLLTVPVGALIMLVVSSQPAPEASPLKEKAAPFSAPLVPETSSDAEPPQHEYLLRVERLLDGHSPGYDVAYGEDTTEADREATLAAQWCVTQIVQQTNASDRGAHEVLTAALGGDIEQGATILDVLERLSAQTQEERVRRRQCAALLWIGAAGRL